MKKENLLALREIEKDLSFVNINLNETSQLEVWYTPLEDGCRQGEDRRRTFQDWGFTR